MPRPRFQKLTDAKQRLILDTAAEEFAAKGFDGASYNEIIEKCGLSKGVMYYYFDDKKDLFDTILLESMREMGSFCGDWRVPSSREEFWQELKRIYNRSLEFMDRDPQAARVIRMSARSFDKLGNIYDQIELQSYNYFKNIIETGQKLKAVRKDLPLELMVAMLSGMGQASDKWLLSRWEKSDSKTRKKDCEIIFNLFIDFLKARP